MYTGYNTNKIRGTLSEEETEYWREKAERVVCNIEGCGTKLASDNKSGVCSVHGGNSYALSHTGKYEKDWRQAFFRSCMQLLANGVAITRKNLETIAVDSPVHKRMVELRREGYITFGGKNTLYKRTSKLLLTEEQDEVRQVVRGVEIFDPKTPCMSEVQRQCTISVPRTKIFLRLAVQDGYLSAIEPAEIITITKKGENYIRDNL